jgi:hypothetical protein
MSATTAPANVVPGHTITYYWRCSLCDTTEPPFFVVHMGHQLMGPTSRGTLEAVGRTLCQRCNEGANPSHAIPQQ